MNTKTVRLNQLYGLMTNKNDYDFLMTFTKNKQRFSRKISCEDIAVIFDWDDTLTAPGINNNSWQVLNNAFSDVGTERDVAYLNIIRKQYHRIEQRRPLTSEEMEKWQRINLKMYVDYGLNLKYIEDEIKKTRMYLSGAMLIMYLLESNAKVCIASSGIRNVIRSTLNLYGIDPSKYGNLQVNATELFFEKDGTLSGWDDNSIVTADKKPWAAHCFSRNWDIEHKNIFVVGDGNTDLNMLDLVSDEATMIFFCPVHKRHSLLDERFNLVSRKAHGFVKEDFFTITNFFIQITEAR